MTSNANKLRPPVRQWMGRDRAIDLVRGYCIASMITGHIAGATILANSLHLFPKFDGASGFVLLSGLLLGITQSKRINQKGFTFVLRATWWRAGVLYVAQLVLSAVGVITVLICGWQHSIFPPNLEQQPLSQVLLGIVTMNIAPPGGDVLRLYVIFLLLAPAVYWMLLRRAWIGTLGLSLALAIIGYAFPYETSFSLFGGATSASWAGWQLLFVSAIVVGWYWHSLDLAARIRTQSIVVLLVSVGVTILCAGVSLALREDEWLFSKYTFPAGRIVVAYAVVAALYVIASWLLDRLPAWSLRPVVVTGQKSLDSYIIQSLAVILFLGATGLASEPGVAQLAAIVVMAACWAWAEIRTKRKAVVYHPRAELIP